MPTLYVTRQNTVLRKTGNRLRLCSKPSGKDYHPWVRKKEIIMEWPCADLTQVMIYGNVQITTQAMHQLLNHGIETAIFTKHGKLLGQLTPPSGKNILLREKQFIKARDVDFCLKLSKTIVIAKIKSSYENLYNYQKNHPDRFSRAEIAKIKSFEIKAAQAHSIDQLRGYEGSASRIYFKLLGKMLLGQFQFKNRSRRPPKDEPNAVLSFGYTIVGSEIQALLDGTGFDPYMGFYHKLDYGRPSLALDLLEIFRHIFIDRLMIKMFNLKIFNNNDFEPVQGGGVYLSASGQKKFFRSYEKITGEYWGDAEAGENSRGYRYYFQECVNSLRKAIITDCEFVVPDISKIEERF